MAKFQLNNVTHTDLTIHKVTAGYLVDFDLPEEVKESMSSVDVANINGVFCMSYYDAPQIGDRLIHKGHQWRVKERIIYATRWHDTRSKKRIPLIRVDYLGPVEDPTLL